jgi:UDP-N-acetylmuramoyl-tripeptide--D-alanyl-D-alanine ligase
VIPLSLAQIAEITGAKPDLAGDEPVVTGPVVIDSRQAEPGSLFVALPGERSDGHDFAAAAVAAGAVAVLASRPTGTPALIADDVPEALARLARGVVDRLPGLRIAGITGSSGKTTTKDLAAQLIETLGPTVSPRNSFNNEIGHPLTVLRATTETQYLISELSARGPGHITRLCQVAPPQVGVVLCVGHAHAGEFGGIEDVARAKAELPAALPADGAAILNADDPRVAAMARQTPARVVWFGCGPNAAVRADHVHLDDQGRPRFTLVMPDGSAPVALRLHGAHNVSNALAAAALAGEFGLPAAAIAEGLTAAEPRSRWRMEVTTRPDGRTVINDAYNANPEALRAALATLAAMAAGRKAWAVLGYMTELGDQADWFHREAGRQATRAGLAGLIVVGPDAAPILAGAREAGFGGQAIGVPDAAAAVATVEDLAGPGDVILVKASRAANLQEVALALTGERPPPPDPGPAGPQEQDAGQPGGRKDGTAQ